MHDAKSLCAAPMPCNNILMCIRLFFRVLEVHSIYTGVKVELGIAWLEGFIGMR